MQNVDMFNAATSPLTFHDFLQRMRHPSAADLVRSIKSFIVSFSNNAPDPERDSKNVQDFYTSMEQAFRTHPLWAGATEDEIDSASEGLEKYLMTKLFNQAFAIPEDSKRDEELTEKMSLVQQFIRPEHLDIHVDLQNETSWLLAQKELQKINTYKSPRDKLGCILSYCKVINNLLLNVAMANSDNPPGADTFLPVLIYVTIKANPPRLHSNLMYIQRYRRQARLVAEAAYFFTNLVSAESFILNIDAKSLSMDESEFEKRLEVAKWVVNSGSSSTINTANQSHATSVQAVTNSSKLVVMTHSQPLEGNKEFPEMTDDKPAYKATRKASMSTSKAHSCEDTKTITEVNKISAETLEDMGAKAVIHAHNMGQLMREYPFLYANYADLRIEDVEQLLAAYKELVLKYISLSKAVESSEADLTKLAVKSDDDLRKIDNGDTRKDSSQKRNEGKEKLESNSSNMDSSKNTDTVQSDTSSYHLGNIFQFNLLNTSEGEDGEGLKETSTNRNSCHGNDHELGGLKLLGNTLPSSDLGDTVGEVCKPHKSQASSTEDDTGHSHEGGSRHEGEQLIAIAEEFSSDTAPTNSDEQPLVDSTSFRDNSLQR